MRRTLYAPGRWVWRMGGASSAFFWPDQDFIRGVALLKSLPEFELEMRAFTLHPMNGRFHRRYLKMRVSAKKVYLLMREVLKPDAPVELTAGSEAPFQEARSKNGSGVATPWPDSRPSSPSA